MTLHQLIASAESLLPGVPAPDGADDPRWQAIIAIGAHIESDPEPIWSFVARWGVHEQEDLRAAVATCLLEHLLEHHFAIIFPRVEVLARTNPFFAATFCMCAKFGESIRNAQRFDALLAEFRDTTLP